jgi:response regulator RpfG family c-di-GMP phosphodiesterase
MMSRPIRIALIEDNPADVHWFRITLEDTPYDCDLQVFTGGLAAVQELQQRPAADLLVVDWYLPMLEGRDLLDALSAIEHLRGKPMAVFAPARELGQFKTGWAGGRIHLLTKPVNPQMISDILRNIELTDSQIV